MSDLIQRTLKQQIAGLQSGAYSAKELTGAYLEQIDKKEKEIGAYLSLFPEEALAAAEAVDKKRAAGEKLAPLAGIPAAIKDNICTKNIRTTCASKMLAEYVPPYDADVIERLKQNDYILLGKLNMDEFAMGSSCENSAFHPTRNPADPSRVPGGSSGGSAAAVAAGEASYTLGSDTGGSIRQPAAFCGVVGMKPTYGSVSRYGLVAFASSLDQIGPLTGTVEDNAIVLNAISGHDRRDATSLARKTPDFASEIGKGAKGLRVGLPKEFFAEGISPQVKDAVLHAAHVFAQLGAQVQEVSMPSIPHALSAYYIISSAEASSNLARYDGVRFGTRVDGKSLDEMYMNTRMDGFGEEVRRRLVLGTYFLSAKGYFEYFVPAQKMRRLIAQDFDKAFEQVDVLMAPTVPIQPFTIEEAKHGASATKINDTYSMPSALAGIPAACVPAGLQVIAPRYEEGLALKVADVLEMCK